MKRTKEIEIEYQKELDRMGVTIHPKFLGAETLLCPLAAYTSSQRLAMYANHRAQFAMMIQCEFPHIFSGYEHECHSRSFSPDKRDGDVVVTAVIPKHTTPVHGGHPSYYNTVIGTSFDTNEIVIFEMNEYPDKNHNFGYHYDFPIGLPQTGSFISADETLTYPSSYSKIGPEVGINANVLFASFPETSEDPVVISDELADRMSYLTLKEYSFKVGEGDVVRNIYGDNDDYVGFPNIGDKVSHDGILSAIRRGLEMRDISDYTSNALNSPQLHDTNFLAEPGSMVIDIDVDVPSKILRQSVSAEFDQLNQYANAKLHYYTKVHTVITKLQEDGYTLSPMANVLLTEAVSRLAENSTNRRSQYKFSHKQETLNYYYVRILLLTENKAAIGNKLTGRHGEKGIISKIVPKSQMPRNEYGIYADIIMHPPSPCNRLNTGQYIEHHILGCAEYIVNQARAHQLGDEKAMYAYFIGFLKDINPKYSAGIYENTKSNIHEFVDSVLVDGFYINIPPFSNLPLDQIYGAMEDKYGYKPTPITFEFDGYPITTTNDAVIGGKYIFLMDSTPQKQITGSSIGYVSQFNTPTKIKGSSSKLSNLISKTPLRVGEDETSIFNMMCGIDVLSRVQQLYANSPKGSEKMGMTLLTADKPSNIDAIDISNDELIRSNSQVGIANHMLGLAGIKHIKGE